MAPTFTWPKSNRTPLGHYVLVHPTPPGCILDCPGAQWCPGPDLGGNTPGHYPSSHCQACIQARGGHTKYGVPFWVAAIKFQQNGLACCIIFSLWFSGCLWIQPSVGWSFHFHQTMWHPFVPNTLPSPYLYQYRYPAWYFSPLRSDVFSKCSLNFFELCIYGYLLNISNNWNQSLLEIKTYNERKLHFSFIVKSKFPK